MTKSQILRELARVQDDLNAALRRVETITRETAALPDHQPLRPMGVAEIAAHFDVKPVTVSSWIRRGKLPEPIARIAAGPIWSQAQVAHLELQDGFPKASTTARIPG
jgi:hypothetical protein